MLVNQLFESGAGSTSPSISCLRGCYSNMASGTVKRAIRQCQSVTALKSSYKRSKIAIKTKTIAILTPYETVIIPKYSYSRPFHTVWPRSQAPETIWKKQWILPRTKVFWSSSKRLLIVMATNETKFLVFVCFDPHVIVCLIRKWEWK